MAGSQSVSGLVDEMQVKNKMGNKILSMFSNANSTPRVGNYNEIKTANNSLNIDEAPIGPD